MDMVFNYLPDVFSYQSTRHYNYENNWLNDTTNRDSRVKYGTKPRAQGTVPKKVVSRDSCKDCPICQERQRRPLATYIRSKSRQDRKQDVLEEEEDREEEQENQEKQEEKPAPK